MTDWLGQRVGVYGYGRTGRACIEYLAPRLVPAIVLVDDPSPDELAEMKSRVGEGRFELAVGDEIPEAIDRIESLILSPGISLKHPNVKRAVSKDVLVVNELELAARSCSGYIMAVTGTNGKSTTTKLLGHVLSALGSAHVLGNIGIPLLHGLDEIEPGDFVALEVSSFQLEAVDRFAPRMAIYTNLTPDHLERHGTMEEYARVKRRMTQRMGSGDFVIVNSLCDEFAPGRFTNQEPSFLQYRSTPGNRLHGAWAANGKINIDLGHEQYELPQDCVKLPGVHNLENAMAVVLAALLMGATPETITERLGSFTGYEHRLEKCRETAGIAFYNDSKATNPEATITALRAMEPPLALILGGRDKLTGLAELVSWVKRKATSVVLYGEAAGRFADELAGAGYNETVRVQDLEEAVPAALGAVRDTSGTVLFSPACASFDQYRSFEERGGHFKELVERLDL